MNLGLLRTRWAAVGAAVAVTLGAGGLGITHATSPAGAVAYVPITPCRVLDTRPAPDTVGSRTSPLGPAETFTVAAHGDSGDCTGIPTSATALQLNVTALGATSGSFLTIWAADANQPTASSLNPQPGAPPIPNAVTTGISPAGEFNIFNAAGSVNVIVDVVGYYTDHNHDDRYYTEAEVDDAIAASEAKTLWVQVNGAGTGAIIRQSGGISLSNSSAGNYFLTFPRDITDCVYTASLGGATVLDNVGSVLGRYGISATIGNSGGLTIDPDEVIVAIWDNDDSNQVNFPFSLVVTCP